MDPEYKKLHEQFVSNSTGTTPEEIVLISCSIPLSVLIIGFTLKALNFKLNQTSFRWSIFEFSCISVPLILCLTSFSDLLPCVLISLGLLLVASWTSAHFKFNPHHSENEKQLLSQQPGKLPFITNYRSSMLLVTAVCILGVDFPVFPRRFAKTETFGFGLMDIGVGSFIFAAGLVSQEARKGIRAGSRLSYIKKSIIESCPILILGLLRLLSVKATGYHEHLTEYGLHWNFFFTLVVTKIFSSLLLATILPVEFCWTACLLLSICNEGLLISGVAEWVFSPDLIDRSAQDLLTANREGVISSVGYLCLYLAGVGWGRHLIEKSTTVQEKAKQFGLLVIWSSLMWASLFYSQDQLFQPPSRRLANWNFFNWMVAYNLLLLAMFLGCDLLVNYSQLFALLPWRSHMDSNSKKVKGHFKQKKSKSDHSPSSKDPQGWSPFIFEAISYNALAYFLLANLLTGAVNFSVQTMHVSSWYSVTIISAYIFVLHTFASLFFKKKLRLKIW